ncbi:putative ABC transport system permease protein [Salinibacterium sp. CAN_S4]|uniref:ABC transporter permease n=1 Tax=Salinibacterium sp. CAN_S4 TaxID=2787727 RepID=UPI0018F00A14
MSRRSAVSDAGLVGRHLRSRASTSVALAVLVGIAVALAALLPRGLVLLSDAELQHALTSLAPGFTDLSGVGEFGALDTTGASTTEQLFGPADAVLTAVPSGLPSPLADSLGPVSWVAMLPPDFVSLPTPRVRVQPILGLAVDLHWQDRVTFIAGAAPRPWAGDPAVPLDIVLSQDYAEQAGFEVGDLIEFTDAPLLVSGIYSADDPDGAYWTHARELRSAIVTRPPGSPTQVRGAAFIDPLSAAGLPVLLERSELRAWYPLEADTMTFAEIPPLNEQLRGLGTLGLYLPSGEYLVFETELPRALDGVTTTVSTVTAVLALVGSAPLGALLAVMALGTRTVLDRRRATLDLAASRGASERQLRTTMLGEGLLIGIPSAVAALVAVTLLLPVPVGPVTVALPILLALLVPALFVGGSLRSAGSRNDLGARGARRRWILELAVVALAALAVFLLVRRGLVATEGGSVDPLLAATPLLLSLVVCVVVLRLYPLPLLALQRAARAGTSPVGLVGATASIRAGSAAFGTVLAMVVGVSTAAFSLVLAATLSAGLGTAAMSETGADIRVDAVALDNADAIEAIAGVHAVAGLSTVGGVPIAFGQDTPRVTVVFADTAALHEVRPDIPALAEGSILVSPDLADRAGTATRLNGHPVTVAGSLPGRALPDLARSWVLVDDAEAVAIFGSERAFESLLIATEPGTDVAATAETIGDLVTEAQLTSNRDRVEVTDIATLRQDAAARPSIAGLTIALVAAAGISLLLCVISVALGALGSAGSRARTLGVLRLLGMSPTQLRGVLAWELAPVTVTALVSGIGFGVALAVAIVALVDLRAIVGGSAVIPVSIPWMLLTGAAVFFAAVVAATGALSSAAARRLTAAAAVRMGAE